MRPAAGRVIEGVRLDDTDEPRHLGRPAQWDFPDLFLRDEIGFDLPVLEDDLVRPALDALDVSSSASAMPISRVETSGAEMEGSRLAAQPLEKGLGQDMLAGMLLHVIEPDRPVDLPLDAVGRDFRRQNMDDHLAVLDDIQDLDAVDRSFVPGLAAGLRIKAGPVKDDGRLALNDLPSTTSASNSAR